MKALLISFLVSFAFLFMCIEIILYVRVREELKQIERRRKRRGLIQEVADFKLKSAKYQKPKHHRKAINPDDVPTVREM